MALREARTDGDRRIGAASGVRSAAFLATLPVLVALLLVQACTTREVIGVVIGSVIVTPDIASLLEGESLAFTASVTDERGVSLGTAVVEWSSDEPTVLSIGPDGMAAALLRGTATIRADFQGVSGQAIVTIIPAPQISVDPAAVAFFGGAGGTPPAPETVSLTNGGGGTLRTLRVDVQYNPGEPADWLDATLAGAVAPTTLSLAVQTAGLPPAVYSATVSLSSPDDRNSPLLVPVSLSLTALSITESGGSTEVDESGTTAAFIFERCDGERSVARILDDLVAEFDAPADVLRSDLNATLTDLRGKHLLS